MIVDASQLVALSADLGAAPVRATVQVARAVHEAAESGRDKARDLFVSQVRQLYLPHYAASITAESMGPAAEFGPDSALSQGSMGRGVEFGSANHGPIAHMMPAADALERELSGDVADVGEESVFGL